MNVERVVEAIEDAAHDVRRGLEHAESAEAGENPSGETRTEADVLADDVLEDHLTALDEVGEYASEERDGVVDCGEGYSVAVDPLDGSSNLETNNVVGTIAGIYGDELPAPGRELEAAVYVVYGPLTTMTVAHQDSVRERVLETGEVRDITLPEPYVYGFGGRRPGWTQEFREYASEVEQELKLRYGGSMVGDVNQMVHKGGVFVYPALQSRPEGKLRLQFEAAPMAYIVESAGGASTDGEQSLLDVEPTELHQRTPVYLGNQSLVDRAENHLQS